MIQKGKSISMVTIVDAGIGIETMYYSIGATRWAQLVELGIIYDDLVRGRDTYPLKDLVRFYKITFSDLKRDLGMKFDHLAQLRATPADLRRLQLNVDGMCNPQWEHPLNKKTMIGFRYTLAQWKMLGLRKEHLFRLNIIPLDYKKLRWDGVDVVHQLQLTPQDNAELERRSDVRRATHL